MTANWNPAQRVEHWCNEQVLPVQNINKQAANFCTSLLSLSNLELLYLAMCVTVVYSKPEL